MSKRNLGSVTQSEFLGFIEEYGIAMCYDHQLSSTKQTALDAPEGYIPLYLSLFSIGNLRLPFNHFCHDVFEFSNCHFPLLDPFGVARISFRNFMKRPGQVPTFFARPADQPVNAGSPFMDRSKVADDNDQGESSFVPKNQDVAIAQEMRPRNRNRRVQGGRAREVVSLLFQSSLPKYEHVAVNSTRHGLDTATIGKPTSLEFKRISLTGFRSCISHSRYQSILKQTTRISIVIVNTVRYHSDVLAISQG
ncbi:hypothetical protein Tco_1256908 [Tanacetum coccineum]